MPFPLLLGDLTMTSSLCAAGIDHNDLADALDKHAAGNWGDLCAADSELQNLAALAAEPDHGTMFMSKWTIKDTTVWIITHYGYATTCLLPSDY